MKHDDSKDWLAEFLANDVYVEAQWLVPIEKIYPVAAQWVATHLVPVQGFPTWDEQNRRGGTEYWKLLDFIERLNSELYTQIEKNDEMREQLIEARKELSKMKRSVKMARE